MGESHLHYVTSSHLARLPSKRDLFLTKLLNNSSAGTSITGWRVDFDGTYSPTS